MPKKFCVLVPQAEVLQAFKSLVVQSLHIQEQAVKALVSSA